MSPHHLAPFSFYPSTRDDLPAPKTDGHSLRSCRDLLVRSPALSGEILNRVQDDRREWGCFRLDLENGPVDGPDSHPPSGAISGVAYAMGHNDALFSTESDA
jgi:hypothetical protein